MAVLFTSSEYPLYSDTTVRLVGGLTKYQGRLEVYYNGSWGTVSYYQSNHFDLSELNNISTVACRSLGLPW